MRGYRFGVHAHPGVGLESSVFGTTRATAPVGFEALARSSRAAARRPLRLASGTSSQTAPRCGRVVLHIQAWQIPRPCGPPLAQGAARAKAGLNVHGPYRAAPALVARVRACRSAGGLGAQARAAARRCALRRASAPAGWATCLPTAMLGKSATGSYVAPHQSWDAGSPPPRLGLAMQWRARTTNGKPPARRPCGPSRLRRVCPGRMRPAAARRHLIGPGRPRAGASAEACVAHWPRRGQNPSAGRSAAARAGRGPRELRSALRCAAHRPSPKADRHGARIIAGLARRSTRQRRRVAFGYCIAAPRPSCNAACARRPMDCLAPYQPPPRRRCDGRPRRRSLYSTLRRLAGCGGP